MIMMMVMMMLIEQCICILCWKMESIVCVGEDCSAGRRLGGYVSCTGIDTGITGRLSLVFDLFFFFFKGAHVNMLRH